MYSTDTHPNGTSPMCQKSGSHSVVPITPDTSPCQRSVNDSHRGHKVHTTTKEHIELGRDSDSNIATGGMLRNDMLVLINPAFFSLSIQLFTLIRFIRYIILQINKFIILGSSQSVVIHEAQNVNYLIQQLRSTVSTLNNDGAIRLVDLIDQSIGQIITDAGLVDWQSEIDLALQPLRSENAQLRRLHCHL